MPERDGWGRTARVLILLAFIAAAVVLVANLSTLALVRVLGDKDGYEVVECDAAECIITRGCSSPTDDIPCTVERVRR